MSARVSEERLRSHASEASGSAPSIQEWTSMARELLTARRVVEAAEAVKTQLRLLADRRYCMALDYALRTECLGWEAKVKGGAYGTDEHVAHATHNRLMGEHRGLAEAATVVEAALAAHRDNMKESDMSSGGRVERQRAVNPPVSDHGGCESHPTAPPSPPAALPTPEERAEAALAVARAADREALATVGTREYREAEAATLDALVRFRALDAAPREFMRWTCGCGTAGAGAEDIRAHLAGCAAAQRINVSVSTSATDAAPQPAAGKREEAGLFAACLMSPDHRWAATNGTANEVRARYGEAAKDWTILEVMLKGDQMGSWFSRREPANDLATREGRA